MVVQEIKETSGDRINDLGRRISQAILLAVPGPLFAFLFYRQRFAGLIFADSMDYAQIARHVSQGHGFVTSIVRPLSLALGQSGPAPIPDTIHPPLFGLALALFYGALGAKDATSAIAGIVFFLACIPLVFILAGRLFDRRVAVLSTVLFAMSDRVLLYAISGLPITFAMFLVMALLLGLTGRVRPVTDSGDPAIPRPPRWTRAFWAGVLVALCFLTSYPYLVLLIPVGLYLLGPRGRRRWSHGAIFLLAFLAITAPWFVRNYSLTGNPFFTLQQYEVVMQTSAYPAFTLFRTAPDNPPSVVPFLFTAFFIMVRKFIGGLENLYNQLPQLISPYLLPFFFVGIFSGTGRRTTERIRWVFYGTTALLVIVSALMSSQVEIFMPLVPMVFILGSAFLLRTVENLQIHSFYRNALLVAMGALITFPTLLGVVFAAKPVPDPTLAALEDLGKVTPKSSVIITDVPWAVAWHADRTAVWLPQRQEDLDKVNKRLGRANLIFLTSMLPSYPAEEQVDVWKQMYFQMRVLKGFRVAKVYESRSILFAKAPVGARPAAGSAPPREDRLPPSRP